MIVNFNDVSFKSTSGDIVETIIINGVLAVKFADSDEFIEFWACDEGWWWAGPLSYSVSVYGDDLLVCKGNGIGGNPILYKRV